MSSKQKQSILCPKCRKLISRDEPRCPYCNVSAPGSFLKNNLVVRAFGGMDTPILAIMYLNIGMYILSLLLNPSSIRMPVNLFQFLSPGNQSLTLLGMTGTVPIDSYHRWWSLISANYLHGSIIHIVFNMLAFRQLAPLVIEEYGTYRMGSLYTLGGVIGFLISYLAGVPFTIGASAAVCSLMGALLYYGKRRGGVYGHIIYKQISGWVLGIFLYGFFLPGINNWGHGGGILAGILLGFLLGYREERRENLFHKVLFILCGVTTVGVLIWAVLSALVTTFL
jgi:rhomboid protease GluP